MFRKGSNDDIVGFIVLVIAILVVLANVLVCGLVISIKRLRSHVNGFVASLAVSDILTALMTLANFYYHDKHKTETLRGFIRFSISFVTMSEILNLCGVAYERYLAVVKPFQYKTKIHKMFAGLIISIWSISLCASLLNFLRLSKVSKSILRLIKRFFVFLFILVPFAYMAVTYLLIFLGIKKQKRRIRELQEAQRRPITLRQQKETKIVKMFLLVAVLYILSWIPAILYDTVRKIRKFFLPGFKTSLAIQVFIVSAVLTSLMNPFIYAFAKQDFRTEINRIFRKLSRGENITGTGGGNPRIKFHLRKSETQLESQDKRKERNDQQN